MIAEGQTQTSDPSIPTWCALGAGWLRQQRRQRRLQDLRGLLLGLHVEGGGVGVTLDAWQQQRYLGRVERKQQLLILLQHCKNHVLRIQGARRRMSCTSKALHKFCKNHVLHIQGGRRNAACPAPCPVQLHACPLPSTAGTDIVQSCHEEKPQPALRWPPGATCCRTPLLRPRFTLPAGPARTARQGGCMGTIIWCPSCTPICGRLRLLTHACKCRVHARTLETEPHPHACSHTHCHMPERESATPMHL